MIDSIPDAEKATRLQVLLDRQREIQRVNYAKHLGQIMEVMVEGTNPARGQISGRSSQNKPVNFTDCAAYCACARQLHAGEDFQCISKQSRRRGRLTALAQEGESMDIEVRIRGLMMDPSTNMPIVVLKDVASETVMPIWVGIFEANAIAIEIEKMAAPRPMTHDLTRNLIRHLNSQLERLLLMNLKTIHSLLPYG